MTVADDVTAPSVQEPGVQEPGAQEQKTHEHETQELAAEPGRRVAMRVVFPNDGDLDAIPLYVDRADTGADQRTDDLLSRRSLRVRAGRRVSLGSYMNAFPAGYWRAWTEVDSVRLTVRTTGDGSIFVYKSNARGASQQVTHVAVSGAETTTFELTLKPFGDGGYYWFDLAGAEGGLTLVEADWSVPDLGGARSTITLGVTTFNRTDFCVRTIGMVAADPELRGYLDQLLVIDQGTEKVRDEAGFAEVAADLGDQLRIIDQPNLGGSGGFSRCMYETVRAGRSDHVILLDDDIILETEGIARLVAFADLCRRTTIVGGHMFDMNNRATLHQFAEIINPFHWQPGMPKADQEARHDFAKAGLRETSWMHQRMDVDYNGWWMCLIPVSVIEQLGLALPLFIKWDDSEYGLRAKEAGIPTVTLPGAAVWHVSWIDKDDLVGWQAYFHSRNRLITALMYCPIPQGGRYARGDWFLDLKHLVAMQYYTGEVRLWALRDAMSGPERLHDVLATRLPEIRAAAADFDDGRVIADVDSLPPVRSAVPFVTAVPPPNGASLPRKELMRKGMKAVARQLLTKADPSAARNPQARIPHKDNKWYEVARTDSALVSTADGTGVTWYKRDPERFRAMTIESAKLHRQVRKDWDRLREVYLAARTDLTSFAAWERTFGITDVQETAGE